MQQRFLIIKNVVFKPASHRQTVLLSMLMSYLCHNFQAIKRMHYLRDSCVQHWHVYNKCTHTHTHLVSGRSSVYPRGLRCSLLSSLRASTLLDMSCPALPACAPIQKTHPISILRIWPQQNKHVYLCRWDGITSLVELIRSCSGRRSIAPTLLSRKWD